MDPFADLKNFFAKLSDIPAAEWTRALPLFSIQKIEKGEYFFRQGAKAEKLGLLKTGLTYLYYEDDRGREKVRSFICRGQVVAAHTALIENRAASFSAKALENSTLYTISHRDLLMLYDRHPSWDRAGRRYLDYQLLLREKKEESLFLMTPAERYRAFIENHQEIINRVPQYLIASYIGITPVALSRIRKRSF